MNVDQEDVGIAAIGEAISYVLSIPLDPEITLTFKSRLRIQARHSVAVRMVNAFLDVVHAGRDGVLFP